MSAGSGTHTLIYDGACRLCRRSVEWVTARDGDERIRALPYQDPEVAREFPGIPPEQLESAMQLVGPGGERRQGADAFQGILELLPGWGALASGFDIPGVRRVAARVYGWIARNRRGFGCGSHCGLGDGDAMPDPGMPEETEPGGRSRPGGI